MKTGNVKEVSISKATESLLKGKPFLKDLFRIDAVNYSGLARHIIPELKKITGNKTINVEAVVMAIRRFAEKVPKKKLSQELAKQMAKFDIVIKNNMVELSLPQNEENYDIIIDTYSKINWQAGETMHIFQSIGELSVLMDERNYTALLKKEVKEELLHFEENLSLFTINTTKELIEIPGGIHFFTHLLVENDITLVDIASTFTKMLFVIKDKDATKVYELFNRAIKDAKDSIEPSEKKP